MLVDNYFIPHETGTLQTQNIDLRPSLNTKANMERTTTKSREVMRHGERKVFSSQIFIHRTTMLPSIIHNIHPISFPMLLPCSNLSKSTFLVCPMFQTTCGRSNANSMYANVPKPCNQSISTIPASISFFIFASLLCISSKLISFSLSLFSPIADSSWCNSLYFG